MDSTDANPERLSRLPTEVILRVMSHLSAKDIAILQRVNRILGITISCSEQYICDPIVKRELSRLADAINHVRLLGVPFNDAIRRFFQTFRYARRRRHYNIQAGCHICFFSDTFSAIYHEQNPESEKLDLRKYTWNLLMMDHFFQYRELPPCVSSETPAYGQMTNALLDATDETIPAETRYQRLMGGFDPANSLPSHEPLIRLCEEIFRVPILDKADWLWRASTHIHDASPPQLWRHVRSDVRAQIKAAARIGARSTISHFYPIFVTQREWASRVSFSSLTGAGAVKRKLLWAALLESVALEWI